MGLPAGVLYRFRCRVLPVLSGPPMLAFLPAATLAAYWTGGETALVGLALGLPLVFALAGIYGRWPTAAGTVRDGVTGLMLREEFEDRLTRIYTETGLAGTRSACFIADIGGFAQISERNGQATADATIRQVAERIEAVLHDRGQVARLGDARLAVYLTPVRHFDLELATQLAGALHTAAETPVTVGGATLYPACTLGLCLRHQVTGEQAGDWLTAAVDALSEARQAGPSGIRAYSVELQKKTRTRADLRCEAASALENGQIRPWFQPQISTETGKVTGFEALARWVHPVHGMVAPDMFLPVMEEAGLLERLGEVILRLSLEAVQDWDRAGVSVPRVGVNFAGDELRNPRLVDKVRWDLDRFDLTPDRLTVEILESVVSDAPSDRITRNIAGLAALGCRIDLDDFGTGHASIASVKRFAVSRLKIDRGFVAKADRDRQQQKMIAAILTMAEQLGLETLAEGVETAGEHTFLAQLGCDHVQGFGIGRPMPFDQTLDWIAQHEAGLQAPPRIGRQAR